MASIEETFEEALALPPEERVPFVEEACGDDSEKLEALLGLLRDAEEAADFFETVRVADRGSSLDRAGTEIGRYKLLQEIGEGGFGTVFMAEQREPITRRVALKIIKPGMDTKQVIARFEAERQALAMMDHPNIAKVLDAGTTESGRPYFVMELVRGVPITQFCDDHSLDVQERLCLFRQVCSAVQHAHQKGIIHRDLSPSNILVGMEHSEPASKIIDFGIAKALDQRLTDKTLFTRHREIIGKPLYMSPEQASLDLADIDTRSDIYSLGIILYELLAGKPPIDKNEIAAVAYEEMRRMICEKSPPKPSTRLTTCSEEERIAIARNRNSEPVKLSKFLRGDLDWILLKALEKDRRRRYDSVSGLSEDIQRFLSLQPVTASPPSRSYALRQFLRRNRGPVAASLAIVLSLILGIFGTSLGMFKNARLADELGLRTQELEEEKAERDAVEKSIDALRNERLALGKEITNLKSQEQTLHRKNREYQVSNEALSEENENLELRSKVLEATSAVLEERSEVLEERNRALEVRDDELSSEVEQFTRIVRGRYGSSALLMKMMKERRQGAWRRSEEYINAVEAALARSNLHLLEKSALQPEPSVSPLPRDEWHAISSISPGLRAIHGQSTTQEVPIDEWDRWNTHRVDGTEFVTFPNLAAFYGLDGLEGLLELGQLPPQHAEHKKIWIRGIGLPLLFPVPVDDVTPAISLHDARLLVDPILRPHLAERMRHAPKVAVGFSGPPDRYRGGVARELVFALEQRGFDVEFVEEIRPENLTETTILIAFAAGNPSKDPERVSSVLTGMVGGVEANPPELGKDLGRPTHLLQAQTILAAAIHGELQEIGSSAFENLGVEWSKDEALRMVPCPSIVVEIGSPDINWDPEGGAAEEGELVGTEHYFLSDALARGVAAYVTRTSLMIGRADPHEHGGEGSAAAAGSPAAERLKDYLTESERKIDEGEKPASHR